MPCPSSKTTCQTQTGKCEKKLRSYVYTRWSGKKCAPPVKVYSTEPYVCRSSVRRQIRGE